MDAVRGLLVVLVAAVAGCGTDPSPITATTTTAGIGAAQQVVDEARLELGAPGVLAAVARGHERTSVVSGAGDRAGTPLSSGSTVPIGSVTKVLTAMLVLDAVQRGELALETTVHEVLPGTLRDGSAVTIRMLLDHTSGVFAVGDEGDLLADIGRLTDPAMQAEAVELAAAFGRGEAVVPSVRLLVALAETHDRYGPPGTVFHYSNVNYLLLGGVLEVVTGQPLPVLLQRRVAGPLGLTRTRLAEVGEAVDVRGHVVDDSGALIDPGNAHLLLRGNGASGGVTSTTDELLTIVRAAVTGDLLDRELTAAMLSPSGPSDGAYGLGIASYHLRCGTFYGHAGGIAGVDVIALVSAEGTDGAVVAANARAADGQERLLPVAERLVCADLRLG